MAEAVERAMRGLDVRGAVASEISIALAPLLGAFQQQQQQQQVGGLGSGGGAGMGGGVVHFELPITPPLLPPSSRAAAEGLAGARGCRVGGGGISGPSAGPGAAAEVGGTGGIPMAAPPESGTKPGATPAGGAVKRARGTEEEEEEVDRGGAGGKRPRISAASSDEESRKRPQAGNTGAHRSGEADMVIDPEVSGPSSSRRRRLK